MAKKPAKKMPTKKGANRPTPAALRGVLIATTKQAGAGGAAAAAAGLKPVTFTCSNAGCLVGISSGSLNLVFSGSGAAMFPVGASTIFYRIQGPKTAVTLTTTGGTLSAPIAGTPPFGGMRTLTVV